MQRQDLMAWMLTEALEQLHRTDRLQRRHFRTGGNDLESCWEPPVDLIASQGALRVTVALPGVVPDQFDVTLEDSVIIVRGERPLAGDLVAGDILRLEIPYGYFERRIALPHGMYRLAGMQLENGCLRLHLERLP